MRKKSAEYFVFEKNRVHMIWFLLIIGTYKVESYISSLNDVVGSLRLVVSRRGALVVAA